MQLALGDAELRSRLRQLIAADPVFLEWRVQAVDRPDAEKAGVLVVDSEALGRLPQPLPHPERVVLITQRSPDELTRAWKAGIVSVVFVNEPLATTMLAILAARYRSCISPV